MRYRGDVENAPNPERATQHGLRAARARRECSLGVLNTGVLNTGQRETAGAMAFRCQDFGA
ncbi:MAG TPA: hypothetical protein VH139_11545, partial [Acidobacteriaceae bacterium]|nr:hypothetical protein [Acidobacteriaceae bacterium]